MKSTAKKLMSLTFAATVAAAALQLQTAVFADPINAAGTTTFTIENETERSVEVVVHHEGDPKAPPGWTTSCSIRQGTTAQTTPARRGGILTVICDMHHFVMRRGGELPNHFYGVIEKMQDADATMSAQKTWDATVTFNLDEEARTGRPGSYSYGSIVVRVGPPVETAHVGERTGEDFYWRGKDTAKIRT
jgi:hypothetical protein